MKKNILFFIRGILRLSGLSGMQEHMLLHTRHSTSSLLPAGSIAGALYHKLQTQSSAPEDGRNYRPKHVELIEIINKIVIFASSWLFIILF